MQSKVESPWSAGALYPKWGFKAHRSHEAQCTKGSSPAKLDKVIPSHLYLLSILYLLWFLSPLSFSLSPSCPESSDLICSSWSLPHWNCFATVVKSQTCCISGNFHTFIFSVISRWNMRVTKVRDVLVVFSLHSLQPFPSL